MLTVDQILNQKGRQVFSISPEASVLDALRLMSDREVGALIVLNGDKLAGLISERDYARKVILAGRSSKDTLVDTIMTREVITVTPDTDVNACMSLMTSHKIRHLPVMKGVDVVGMLSIGDIVKAIIADQAHTIEQLEHYISGVPA